MEMPAPLQARRVTREDLYKMFWDKPMIRLAEEFGITGNGLAKICDKLDVPLSSARPLGQEGGWKASRRT